MQHILFIFLLLLLKVGLFFSCQGDVEDIFHLWTSEPLVWIHPELTCSLYGSLKLGHTSLMQSPFSVIILSWWAEIDQSIAALSSFVMCRCASFDSLSATLFRTALSSYRASLAASSFFEQKTLWLLESLQTLWMEILPLPLIFPYFELSKLSILLFSKIWELLLRSVKALRSSIFCFAS